MISACMIVRDGAETIEAALKSVRDLVNEIVVGIDSRTKDNSREIIEKYTNNVFEFDWIDDFAYARNLVASKSTNDFIFVIDVDDIVIEGCKGHIINEIKNDVKLMRVNLVTAPGNSITSPRIYDRRFLKFRYRIHEAIEKIDSDCEIWAADIPISMVHKHPDKVIEPGRNIRILKNIIDEMPRYLFYMGRECLDSNDYKNGIIYFNRYLPLSTFEPEKLDAMVNLATCYGFEGDFTKAREYCFRVLSCNTNFVPAYNLLGQLDMSQDKYDSAITWFESATKCKDTSYMFNDVLSALFNCWGNLIVAYAKTGQIEKSRNAIENAKSINCDSEWLDRNIESVRDLLK
jgi:tetratricopeptide (TPR) repeat protein